MGGICANCSNKRRRPGIFPGRRAVPWAYGLFQDKSPQACPAFGKSDSHYCLKRFVYVRITNIIAGAKDQACIHSTNSEKLFKEIIALDKVERRSSIIAIKDSYQQYPHRFLLYHDNGWNCDFFPNHASASSIVDTSRELKSYISGQLEVPPADLEIRFVREKTNEKPSTEHNGEMRLYTYWLFDVSVKNIPDFWRQSEFDIADRHYKWMSTDSMLADARINEINNDVVSLVKDTLS